MLTIWFMQQSGISRVWVHLHSKDREEERWPIRVLLAGEQLKHNDSSGLTQHPVLSWQPEVPTYGSLFLARSTVPLFRCFTNFCLIQGNLDNKSTFKLRTSISVTFVLEVYLSLIKYPDVGWGHILLHFPRRSSMPLKLNSASSPHLWSFFLLVDLIF